MAFAGINYLAVVLAAVASFLFGAVWYGALGRQWMDALGKTKADLTGPDGRASPLPFIITAFAQLLMAYMLAGVIGHLGPGQVTIRNGLITGLFMWAGFVMTSLLVNHSFQGANRSLTIIDGGHWLFVLLIQGLVLGFMGVR